MAELSLESPIPQTGALTTTPDRKSKMVSFRLSPEEYRKFRNACAQHGVRNVSELARTAMQTLIEPKECALPVHLQVQELRDRITVLSADLDRLAHRLEPRETPLGFGAAC